MSRNFLFTLTSIVFFSLFLLGLAHVAFMYLREGIENRASFDLLKNFYISGEAWLAGLSPYDLETVNQMRDEPIEHSMLYPPNWYFPVIAMPFLGETLASDVWLMITVVALYVSCWMLVKMFFLTEVPKNMIGRFFADYTRDGQRIMLMVMGLFGFIALTKAYAQDIYLGNTGMTAAFGAVILTYATVARVQPLAVIGLVILMLKPQIGIIFSFVLLLDAFGRRTVIWAAIISMLLAAPAFLYDTPVGLVSDYLHNMTVHGAVDPNLAHRMTGIRNFIWYGTGADLPTFAWLAIGIVFAIGIAAVIRGKLDNEVQRTLLTMAACAVAVVLFVPLHDYDFLILAPVVLLLGVVVNGGWILAAIASFCLTRVATELGDRFFGTGGPWSDQEVAAFAYTISAVAAGIMLLYAVFATRAVRTARA